MGERKGGVRDNKEGGGVNDRESDMEGGIAREVYRIWRETMREAG